jgi:hypothetical protein
MKPAAVEFLVHMALATGVASINYLADDGLVDRDTRDTLSQTAPSSLSHSEHIPHSKSMWRPEHYTQQVSVTGGRLDLQWKQLRNIEYLTDGGNSWIHTAILDGRPVVVKTLKPECQDVVMAINEIEGELGKCIHGAFIVRTFLVSTGKSFPKQPFMLDSITRIL